MSGLAYRLKALRKASSSSTTTTTDAATSLLDWLLLRLLPQEAGVSRAVFGVSNSTCHAPHPPTIPRNPSQTNLHTNKPTRQPTTNKNKIQQDLLGLLLLLLIVHYARHLRRLLGDWRAAKACMGDRIFSLLRELPPVRRKLEV